MSVEMDPAATHAVIVGIERYEIGWEADGAANDAVRAARWLRAAAVPGNQVTLVVDALDSNRDAVRRAADGLGVTLRTSARRDDLMTIFTTEIPAATGQNLVLFWGGHGALDEHRDRALFTADASTADKRNIRVDDLLEYLADREVRGFHRQVAIIDACANFFETMKSRTALTRATFPVSGSRRVGVQQFVLYAAAQGQTAGHRQSVRSGEFSTVVLDRLGERWPPDLPALSTELARHFDTLRELGRSRQTPVYFSRTVAWSGSEVQQDYGGLPVSGAVHRVSAETGVTALQLRRFAATLAGSPVLAPAERRRALGVAVAVPADADPTDAADFLLAVVTAALANDRVAVLFETLDGHCATDDERLSVAQVKRRWHMQRRIAEPLRHFFQVDASQLRSYYDVVPDRQLAPRLEELDDVLEYLAECGGADERAPLLRFVARLEALTGREMAPEWFGLSPQALARLRAREAVAARARSRSHLVIDLRAPGAAGPAWPTEVVGYLRTPDGAWAKKPVACAATLAGAQQAANELVNWADGRQDENSDLTVGFLTPRSRFDDAPEGWEFTDALTGRVPIREEYPVMLHFGERLQVPRAYRRWRTSVQRIATDLGVATPTVEWIEQPGQGGARTISQRVVDAQACCVGFGFVPGPLRGDLPDDPLVAAINPGAPYLVWLDAEPADWPAARAALTALVQQGDFDDVPVRVLRLRQGDDDGGLGAAVRLLWDKKEWLPEFGKLTGLAA